MAMCLRQVHSLHLHSVQAFRSFRFTQYTSLSFTSFRLRSFHPPLHRTAKAIHSLHFTNPTLLLFVFWHPDFLPSIFLHIRDCSNHYKHPKQFVSFRLIIAFAFIQRCNKYRYALFFSAKCLPHPTHQIQLIISF